MRTGYGPIGVEGEGEQDLALRMAVGFGKQAGQGVAAVGDVRMIGAEVRHAKRKGLAQERLCLRKVTPEVVDAPESVEQPGL